MKLQTRIFSYHGRIGARVATYKTNVSYKGKTIHVYGKGKGLSASILEAMTWIMAETA